MSVMPSDDNVDPGGPQGRRPDLTVVGPVFLDMIFTGLVSPPTPGLEVRSSGLGISPGGVANTAVAAARLGLSVRLETKIGADANGEYIWSCLTSEGIDLSGTRRLAEWKTPLTVSLVYDSDRFMVTHESAAPFHPSADTEQRGATPRALLVSLPVDDLEAVRVARRQGGVVFADVGWDESERWSERDLDALSTVDVFLPNHVEAMSYTRTGSPEAAAKALAKHVRLVVVKCGSDGALATRSGDDMILRVPALDVQVWDTTGAGDVFDAAFVFSVLSGWDLGDGLRFATLCAGLSVAQPGGSLSAPAPRDIALWLANNPGGPEHYRFLASFLQDS